MSNGLKPSLRAVQGSLSDRITSVEERATGLEENFTRFLIGVSQRLDRNDERLGLLEENAEALKELNGVEEVNRLIIQRRVERMRAEATIEKARLDEGLADGYILTAEKVTDDSILVGRYLDKDGVPIEPGWVQLATPKVQPQFRLLLLDQPAGTKIDIPNGNKFELLSIYTIDEEKTKAVIAAKQQAAADAAAEAAKADEVKDTGVPVVEDVQVAVGPEAIEQQLAADATTEAAQE